MPINLKSALFFAAIFTQFPYVQAQDKLPSKAEFNELMDKGARESSKVLSGKKIDDYTTVHLIAYDYANTTFTYFYLTDALKILNQTTLSDYQKAQMRKANQERTCSSQLKVFMKPYGLKVTHIFLDSRDKVSTVYKLTLTDKDC